MLEINYTQIFSYFLEALKVNGKVKITRNGYRTVDDYNDYELFSQTNSIINRFKTPVLDGDFYTYVEELKVYKIIRDMGNIIVRDENNNNVITITNKKFPIKIVGL